MVAATVNTVVADELRRPYAVFSFKRTTAAKYGASKAFGATKKYKVDIHIRSSCPHFLSQSSMEICEEHELNAVFQRFADEYCYLVLGTDQANIPRGYYTTIKFTKSELWNIFDKIGYVNGKDKDGYKNGRLIR